MNIAEMKLVMQTARRCGRLDHEAIAQFQGYGLKDFKPVHVSIWQVSRLIRWQCLQFNGEFDMEAVDELMNIGRKKFLIIA